MPSWKNLSEKERWTLLTYLRSLAGNTWPSEGPRIA